MSEEKPQITWDTCAIAESASKDPDYWDTVGVGTEEEALDVAFGDTDLYDAEYEYLCEELTSWMTRIHPDDVSRRWKAEGEGMGWQRRSGYKYFSADTGEQFLREILPDTDCTYTITDNGNEIHLSVSHHDAMGEQYFVVPVQGHEDDEDYDGP